MRYGCEGGHTLTKTAILGRLEAVNKELWLVLSLFAIALLLNHVVRTSGEAIPIEARMIGVADGYDALTSDRPYRKAMSMFDVRDVIVKGAGTEFDPAVVAAFRAVFRRGQLAMWSAPLSAA